MQKSSGPFRPAVIVIVDDDAALLASLRFSLELEGFTVRTDSDAETMLATDALKAECLVIDYKLPGMNGLELLRTLRRRAILTPAILITTAPGSAVREQAARAGAVIVEKPLLGNGLSERIRSLCQGNGTRVPR